MGALARFARPHVYIVFREKRELYRRAINIKNTQRERGLSARAFANATFTASIVVIFFHNAAARYTTYSLLRVRERMRIKLRYYGKLFARNYSPACK